MDILFFAILFFGAFLFLAISFKTNDVLTPIMAGILFMICGILLLAEPLTINQVLGGFSYINGTTCNNTLNEFNIIINTSCDYVVSLVSPTVSASTVGTTTTFTREGVVLVFFLFGFYLIGNAAVSRWGK